MTRFPALIAACVLAASTLGAQSDAPRMSDVMSNTEMKETGVTALTPAQRSALDQWLARYTSMIERAASHGAQAAGSAGSGGNGGNGGSQAAPDETYAGPTAMPYGSRIAAVEDGGTTIVLTDGTVWEVNLPDRPSTTNWKKGDYIIVGGRAIELNNKYFFQLINGRDESSAAVAWRGKRQH
jgi:hypothetical protein